MDSKTALALAILRINADVQQTPHIFPLDAVQVAELQEVIATLGDLQDAIQDMPTAVRFYNELRCSIDPS